MKPSHHAPTLHPTLLATALATVLIMAASPPLPAQSVAPASPDAQTLARYDLNRNGRLDPDELALWRADESKAASSVKTSARASLGDVIALSPFEVSATQDRGYSAANTLAGTRLNSKLEDLAGSVSVITKQQLSDMAALDINDIFLYEVGTEGTGQFTDLTNDGRGEGVWDNVSGNPTGANRMRGLSSANIAANGFTASSTIPIDTYNIDAVEIARGPNSTLAGLADAGGTVNLVTSRGNVGRDTSNLQTRFDNFGGHRASIDLNRVIIRDKLAVRFSAVYNETGYVRKPSVDRTNRQQYALKIKPFATTSINASFESFHEFAQRANSVTPRDTVSLWKSRGSPTWDPLTFTATVNGQKFVNPNAATLTQLGLADGFGNTRILEFIDAGQIQLITKAVNPNNPLLGLTATQRMLSPSGEVAAGPLYRISGSTNQAFYDWTAINLAASAYQIQRAAIANVSLDQGLIHTPRHRLDLNVAWRREDQDDYRRQFIGQVDGVGTTVTIDVNERLPDGRPNPYFLRPFIGGVNPQIFKKPVFNDSYRAQLAYQLDLRAEKNFSKWLGLHRAIGYGEYSLRIAAPNNLRFHDTVTDNVNYQPGIANLTPTTSLANNNGALMYPLYYMGNTKGGGVEYANSGPVAANGAFKASYVGATSTSYNLNEPVTIKEVYFALGQQKKKIRTTGASMQSYFLNDQIVTTLGQRNDRVNTQDNLATPLSGGFIDETNLLNFGLNKRWRFGDTRSQGVVIKPLRSLAFLNREANQGSGATRFLAQALRGVNFHYNQSNSFQPADTAYNLYLQELPNPTGTSREYGFSLNLFDDRFSLRVTHQETLQVHTRAGTGVIATRALAIDFDNSTQNLTFGLFDLATSWAQSINPALTLAQAQETAAKQIGYTPAFINSAANKTIADASDAASRGWELELQYNPTRFWTVKVTGNQQEAVDSNISLFMQQFINERLPLWTTLRIPTTRLPDGSQLAGAGDLWWTTATGSNGQPVNYFNTNVQTPLNLAITSQGKKKPQTREYRFRAITNFQLAGLSGLAGDNPWLKNASIGGSYGWSSRGAIGYLAGTPDPDGIVRSLDRTKPFYDRAVGNIDVNLGYTTHFFKNKIRTRFQLNVRNATESGHLQGVAINPDGKFFSYRIIDPRQFIFTTTFDL